MVYILHLCRLNFKKIKSKLLTQAWLVLDCCISHNHFGAFIQFPLEDLLLDTEICRASTESYIITYDLGKSEQNKRIFYPTLQ